MWVTGLNVQRGLTCLKVPENIGDLWWSGVSGVRRFLTLGGCVVRVRVRVRVRNSVRVRVRVRVSG